MLIRPVTVNSLEIRYYRDLKIGTTFWVKKNQMAIIR